MSMFNTFHYISFLNKFQLKKKPQTKRKIQMFMEKN